MAEVELRKETLGGLATLSSRQRRVLELRYGLNGEHPRTLEEIAPAFNVSRERIRQIEKESLKQLKLHASTAKLDRNL